MTTRTPFLTAARLAVTFAVPFIVPATVHRAGRGRAGAPDDARERRRRRAAQPAGGRPGARHAPYRLGGEAQRDRFLPPLVEPLGRHGPHAGRHVLPGQSGAARQQPVELQQRPQLEPRAVRRRAPPVRTAARGSTDRCRRCLRRRHPLRHRAAGEAAVLRRARGARVGIRGARPAAGGAGPARRLHRARRCRRRHQVRLAALHHPGGQRAAGHPHRGEQPAGRQCGAHTPRGLRRAGDRRTVGHVERAGRRPPPRPRGPRAHGRWWPGGRGRGSEHGGRASEPPRGAHAVHAHALHVVQLRPQRRQSLLHRRQSGALR